MYNVWAWLMNELGNEAYSGEKNISNRRIEMFHSSSDEKSKTRVLNGFKVGGQIEVVICTVAFGMGIDIPDIEMVINWGAPRSMLAYWRQVGRCGRGGQRSIAIMFPFPRSMMKGMVEDDLKNFLSNENSCHRRRALECLLTKDMDPSKVPVSKVCEVKNCDECGCKACVCCTHCYETCSCTNKRMDLTGRK